MRGSVAEPLPPLPSGLQSWLLFTKRETDIEPDQQNSNRRDLLRSAGFFMLTLLVWGGLLPSLHPQSVPLTNEEVIRRLFMSSTLKVLKDTLQADKQALQLKSDGNEPLASWLIRNLTDSCLANKFLVYSSADSQSRAQLVVQLSSPEVVIEYRGAGKKMLVFSKGMKRSIAGKYHLQIIGKSGNILFSRMMHMNYQDRLPAGSYSVVEDRALPFTHGTKKQSALLKRWLEPVVITATTMSVIYLFYTLRSNK